MSYAVRKDGQGWRAVNSPDDVDAAEDFSETLLPRSPPAMDKATKWDAIKAERDRRTEHGGCLVDGRWYDTDARSALRYKLLADHAASTGLRDDALVRAGWRPLDVEQRGEIDMTYGLLKRIMSAGIVTAMAIDDAAQQHQAALAKCDDPAGYDYSAGWPPAFTDALAVSGGVK